MATQDFTLGRAGLATSAGGDGLELKCSSFEQSGDECKASGVIRGQSSVNDVNALRQQLNGYDLNTDEPVVPVTWVQDPSIDGFYRVQSVEVSAEVTGRQKSTADGAELAFRWEVELLRVSGFKAPMFEIITTGADRSTAHSITEWSWVGAPYADATDAEVFASRVAGWARTDQVSSTIYYAPSGSKTALYDDQFLYHVGADDFYNGAAGIFGSNDNGTTYRTVVGRQLPTGLFDPNKPVRLANDIVRVTVDSSAATIDVETYDSGAASWESKTFSITCQGSTANAVPFSTATVLRNDPAAVSVRFWFTDTEAVGFFDLTVRRGSWVVEGYASAEDANDQLGVFRGSAEAGTNVTGGLDATSDDAAGNKYQLRSPSAITTDTTNGGIYLTSAARSFPFAIATDAWAGNGTTAPSTSGLYFAAMNHRQTIVAR